MLFRSVMDELGTVERTALHFQAEVTACLNSPKLVLGVLKQAESPFLSQICGRTDTMVWNVTEKNREEIYNSLTNMIKWYFESTQQENI